MQMTLERFDPALHDVQTIARLIYQADPALMSFVFGEEVDAVPLIARLVGMEHNDYAGRRIMCAQHGPEIIGIIAGLTGAERRESGKPAGKEWGTALGLRGMVRAIRWGSTLNKIATTQLADDEYYISALTVDENHRGNGTGSRLLSTVLEAHDVVVTDVNIAKDAAIRFYERHGFVIQKEMTFMHDGRKLGNYQIRREA